MKTPALVLLGLLSIRVSGAQNAPADPYLWLEDVSGERALAWVRAQNAVAQRELEALPDFKPINERLLAIYDSKERIPYVAKHGDFYYNFWRDAQHVRGLWRRTSPEEYRKKDPAWEAVLDLDALAAEEKENWVWKGAEVRFPDYARALVSLSRGGADAVVVREFDLAAKAFVKDGFALPEAKCNIAWRDRDSAYVGTDFGPDSLTDSGYPRVVKLWLRGTPIDKAAAVFEGKKGDVGSEAIVSDEPGFHREFIVRGITTFTSENFLVDGGRLVRLDLPADADFGSFRDQLTVKLRTDWAVGGRTFPSGALLAIPWDRFLAGGRDFAVLFHPGPRVALAEYSTLRHHIIVNELDNVRNRLYVLTPEPDATWSRVPLPAPEFGTISAEAAEPESDDYFMNVTDFLTPSSYYVGSVGSPERTLLKQLPSFFSAEGLEVSQHEALSKDGTRVPYFQVGRRGLPADGSTPTLLYGYGGFEISMTPYYSAGTGASWLERGGVFVLANIRGGGEFGPAWHQAAVKENRQRAYDDFIAVAQDLTRRRVTATGHLGIMGGSNGGLLMGVMLTERPDLFGAVVCQSPLLDMRRYSHLLAGASWMGEYGDPDLPADWAYISRYSPYQNAREDAKYPPVLITTSTRDDRVHPGHARKMAAELEAQHHDVLFYENIEGGHSAGANNREQAYLNALAFTFLLKQLR
ncbi:MAG TPA: prolyl oligopeptidase family serine peptidase [Opitutaceae bacterium]|nr:prolyl oligopeptidase family serine peptidase [Opitutaceae bacterium]